MLRVQVTLEFDLDESYLTQEHDDILDNFQDYYKNHMQDQQEYDPAIPTE